jgi:hypothetical protein
MRFFELVRQTSSATIIIGLYTFRFGLFLITTHKIWSWDWPLFLTIAGWGMTIKSTLYLLVSGLADGALAKRMATSPRGYQFLGAVAIVFGAAITWQAWRHP